MDGDSISFDDRVNRRKALFGTAALGSAFALAAQPVQAQTMIVTDGNGIMTGEVGVRTKDGRMMRAYQAMPSSGAPRPRLRSSTFAPSSGRRRSILRRRSGVWPTRAYAEAA